MRRWLARPSYDGGYRYVAPNQMVAPLADVLFVEMTNRLVEVVGVLTPVVSVAVYSAHELVIEEIVAVAINRAGGRFQVHGQRAGETGAGLGVELHGVRSGRCDGHAEIAGVGNPDAGRRGNPRGNCQFPGLRQAAGRAGCRVGGECGMHAAAPRRPPRRSARSSSR